MGLGWPASGSGRGVGSGAGSWRGGSGASGPMQLPGTGVALDPAGALRRPGSVGESCPHIWFRCLPWSAGLIGCRPWTRTPIRPATRPGHRPGCRRWWPSSSAWPTRTQTGWPMPPWPNGSMVFRGLMDRLEGHWLAELAVVDARGAAGAEEGVAGRLHRRLAADRRLRMSAGAAAGCVRTARALYRGPLTATGQALTDGAISPAHAQVLAHDTQDLPAHVAAEAEPVLLEAARRLDPPRLRRAIAHLRAGGRPRQRPGPGRTAPSAAGAVAVADLGGHGRRPRAAGARGRPDAAGRPGAPGPPHQRPATTRSASPATGRCPHRAGPPQPREPAGSPRAAGSGPSCWSPWTWTASSAPDGLGGETGGPWPLDPETCRRLACDAAVTRVLVTRHPTAIPATTTPDGEGEPGGLAPGSGDPAPPDPWRRPHPTTGGRPDQPGRHRRPTRRPGRPRRRLCGGRLRPAPGLVRSPPSPPLAPWRPHRPRRTWPCSAEPIIARSMRAAGG